MDYEQKYNDILIAVKKLQEANPNDDGIQNWIDDNFPELKEGQDELTWLTKYIEEEVYSLSIDIRDDEDRVKLKNLNKALAWLEKQKPVEQNSEDERIRKALLDACNLSYSDLWEKRGVKKESIIAWLEKQGEQKPKFVAKKEVTGVLKEMLDNIDPVELEETRKEMMESMPTDKAEPKFKVGDWITDGEAVFHITSYSIDYGYQLETPKGTSFHFSNETVEKKYHLWTIEDAKDGDVLAYVTDEEDLWIMIYWSLYEPYEGHVHYHALLVNDNFSDKGTCCICINDLKPATKEQCDLLFQKMKEEGYEWDANKKELMKIERKPTWSEEDEHRAKDTIYFLDTAKKHYASTVELDACIDWIKSLKKRMEKEVVV